MLRIDGRAELHLGGAGDLFEYQAKPLGWLDDARRGWKCFLARYYAAWRGWPRLGDGGRWQPVRLPATLPTCRVPPPCHVAVRPSDKGGRAEIAVAEQQPDA
jgi:hypothetical protein